MKILFLKSNDCKITFTNNVIEIVIWSQNPKLFSNVISKVITLKCLHYSWINVIYNNVAYINVKVIKLFTKLNDSFNFIIN